MHRSKWGLFIVAALALPAAAGAQDKTAEGDLKASSTGASTSGGMCIPESHRQEVSACPANAPKFGDSGNLGRSQAPRSNLQTASRKKEKPKERELGPSIQIDAATLRNQKDYQQRANALLQKEIKGLSRLIKNRSKDDPKRPEILLRLAEAYFELQQQANAKVRSYDEPMYKARQNKDKGRYKQLKAEQEKARKLVGAYRKAAIKAYAMLVQDHPDFRRMDEVLFALAFSLDEMKQRDRARDVYFRLIKDYPQSKFVPNAYLSFAEFYFNEGDMAAANKFYQKVTEFPPERNQVYGYAVYKRAWVLYNLEDFKGALNQFVKTIEFARAHPEQSDAKNLMRQARRELVLPYGMVGDPGKALQFFSRFAADDAQAFEMLESLAELYYDTGAWDSTIEVYHTLMSQKPDNEKLCYWQSRVTNAELARNHKQDGVRELQRMLDLYETKYKDSSYSAEAIEQCRQEGASILVDLATSWHREAIGTDTQPGTNDRATMKLAANLYRTLLDKFPDMHTIEFPSIDKRDWPTAYNVSYYYAELLWKMEDWGQCAPAFDRVVELDPQGKYTADAALAAVLCYNNLYQQEFAASEREVRKEEKKGRGKGKRKAEEPDYGPREFSALESGMLNAFQRYVCFVPDSDDLPTMKYRRARIYYEANRFEEAAVIFKDIAMNHTDSDLAEYAANLYLDSLNVLGTYREPARATCYDEMAEAVPELYGTYCGSENDKLDHESLCEVLSQLRCDIQRKKAEAHQNAQEFRDAAYTYVNIFRKYQECGKMDEVLYNAAINFEAAKLIGRAIKVRNVLIERFPESDLASKAVYLTGANFQALALYSRAADYYEQFASRFPNERGADCTEADKEAGTCPIAHEALQDAVFFRLGLGEDEKAIEDAKMFEKNYRRKHPRETSQVIYSLASIYERDDNWAEIATHYKDYLKRYSRQAMPHEKLRANTQIGVAFWKLDRKPEARRYFQAAIKLWSRGAPEAIGKLEVSDEQRTKFLAEARQATAEALWYMGEYEFAEFQKIKFPELKGRANLEKVNKWAAGPFVQWIEKKGKALKSAEETYGKVRELKAPMWDIAAAERIGVMYRSFVDEFRDAPVPNEIKKDPELMDIYLGSLDEKSKPWVVKATGAFEFCLNLATQVRWFNEFSKQCELELNRLDPRRFPMAAELRGDASYMQSVVARPTAVDLSSDEAEVPDTGDAEATTAAAPTAGGES